MSARPGFRYDQHDARIEQLRVPPHSIEAEQAVLGGLMLAPEAYDRINDKLNDTDFSLAFNGIISKMVASGVPVRSVIGVYNVDDQIWNAYYVLDGSPIKGPRDFVFDTLVVSAGLVDPMLAADREAIGSGEVYDRAYYDRFFAKARPTLERRLSEAIAGTAAVIAHAWEEGGKPSLADVPPQERRRRPAAPPQ